MPSNNSFIAIQTIAREGLMRLSENLVFPALCNRDYSREFGKLGTRIQVRKPINLTAQNFVAGTPVTDQNIIEESITVELNKIATVDVSIEAIDMAMNVDSLNRVFIEPASIALAEKIAAAGMELYKDIPYYSGTAGTAPNALTNIAQATKLLNINKVPTAGRVAVWDPEAQANFQTLPAVVNAEKSGSTAALREGSIGRLLGVDNYMAQGVPLHTPLATGTIKVGANAAAGATSISVSGVTGKFVKGDLLLIGGASYVVTEDTATDTSGAISSVKLYPALKAPAAANASVTLVGAHRSNLMFNRNAFAFVTRPLMPASNAVSYTASANGLSLRVTQVYDRNNKREQLSMDILYNFATLQPELAIRVLG